MPKHTIDLGQLFQAVASTLEDHRESLNQADSHNQDHGDNMVQIFGAMRDAVQARRDADPAEALGYASELLGQRSQSGSAQRYAQGLAQASSQFRDRPIDSANVMQFIQTLLGGAQVPARTPPSSEGDDLLGSLLTGLGTGERGSGIDLGDLVSAGMAFVQSKGQGESHAEALIDAFVAGTQTGSSRPYRAQSSKLVSRTMLQTIGSMLGG